MKGYDTAEYASTRLADTVVRLGNVPVLVSVCEDTINGIRVYYRHIMENLPSDFCNISDLNLDPVPLGYVNLSPGVVYLTRMPMRNDWKQGLRDRNVVDTNGFNQGLPYKAIGRTIMGDFPKFSNCLSRLSDNDIGRNSLAFDREFSIDREGKIIYKSLFHVGDVNMDNGGIRIKDDFTWVVESLDEAMERAA
jgi:hypothetical protein